MKIKSLIFFSYLAIFLMTLTNVQAENNSSGIIEGKIINKTKGKEVVPFIEIILQQYSKQTPSEKQITRTDKNGKFHFKNLSTDSQHSYSLNLNFQGAEYYSDIIIFEKGETLKTLEIPVYDSTVNVKNIKVKAGHYIFDIEKGKLSITEVFIFQNPENKTYVGEKVGMKGKNMTLRFTLPKGFEVLNFQSGLMSCCVENLEDGFYDTMPLYPGQREIAFSYKISYNSSRYIFSPKINYPVENLNFLILDTGIKVESKDLHKEDSLEIQGKRYFRLSGREIEPNAEIKISMDNLPYNQSSLKFFALGVLFILIVSGFIYPFIKRKKSLSPEQELKNKRKQLLSGIANLDDQYEAGNISEEIYLKARSEMKQKLIDIFSKQK
ncbi:MAG: hypothetical protein AB1410_08310 [Acidobacteriota bacterium]